MGSNLPPCPFCGGTEIRIARVTFGHGDSGESVKCRMCGAEISDDYIGKKAQDKWNTRAINKLTDVADKYQTRK